MILFLCETHFQLLNALNIKEQCYNSEKADLILTKSTDFSLYLDSIRCSGFFENVIFLDYFQETEINHLKENINAYLSQKLEYEIINQITGVYSDYFIPVDSSLLQKLIYYKLVKNGKTPKVHIFEEGILTYLQDVHANLSKDGMNHNLFPENQRLVNNIQEILLYKPELYSAKPFYKINPIPQINPATSKVIEVFGKHLGNFEMPKEKYIYLAEPFDVEKLNNNEFDILDKVADIVGKENIIVKLHPRSDSKFFELHGYKTFVESKILWEMYVLNPDFEGKVLITISSGAGTTSQLLYNKSIKSIYLHKIMTLSTRFHAKHPCFPAYFKKVFDLFNREEKCVYCPKSVQELNMILQYLEGEVS